MTDEIKNRGAKFRVRLHCRLKNAVNSYMIANSFGAICGGNLQVFYPWNEIIDENENWTLRFPTVFKSKAAGDLHIVTDREYLEIIESECRGVNNAA